VSEEVEIIVELLEDFLGRAKQHYPYKGQISFDCPVCSYDIKGLDKLDGKGNLEINYGRHVYKCWSCGETHGTHGPLGKLFDKYATKKQKKVYDLLKPEEFEEKEVKKPKLRLPEGYTKFKDSNPIYPIYKQAMNYLKSRGITDEIIDKYQIGFCDKGDYAGRIIVPSYTENGTLNYFIARSWGGDSRFKYKNPVAEKDKIIFNEHLIDWFKDIYLVEGVFDGFFLDNSIPMLGKHLSAILFETIYEKALGNIVICLDGDAWDNAKKLYRELNGGTLYGRVKIVKLPPDKDVCDLRGEINEYYYTMK
jgi:DNA primase